MITRSKTYLIQPKVRATRYGLNSLRYDGGRIWNKLHNDFKVDDYYDFKRLLKYEIADCNCNTCMFCMITCKYVNDHSSICIIFILIIMFIVGYTPVRPDGDRTATARRPENVQSRRQT